MNNWTYERKYDGRRTFFRDGKLWSKVNNDQTRKYPHVIKILENINAILDGEICIPNGTAQDIAKKSNWPHAVYVVFDVLEADGRDMRTEPLAIRIQWLHENLPQTETIQLPERFDDYHQAWATVLKNNWEGIIKKNLDSKYNGLESFNEGCWEKIKYWKEALVEIIGFQAVTTKGSFILAHKTKKGIHCKLSALSTEIKAKYEALKQKGRVFADINYLYMTENNSYFQPSLVRLK